jgi:hypothetical protein
MKAPSVKTVRCVRWCATSASGTSAPKPDCWQQVPPGAAFHYKSLMLTNRRSIVHFVKTRLAFGAASFKAF